MPKPLNDSSGKHTTSFTPIIVYISSEAFTTHLKTRIQRNFYVSIFVQIAIKFIVRHSSFGNINSLLLILYRKGVSEKMKNSCKQKAKSAKIRKKDVRRWIEFDQNGNRIIGLWK